MRRPYLMMAAPCIASVGILLIVNAVLSGGGWPVPTAVIAGTGVIMAGIMILKGKKSDVSVFKP